MDGTGADEAYFVIFPFAQQGDVVKFKTKLDEKLKSALELHDCDDDLNSASSLGQPHKIKKLKIE